MATLGEMAFRIRSKNAGPFTVTIDLFFDAEEPYAEVCEYLSVSRLAEIYRLDPSLVSRFELPDLLALKFSFPRHAVQGSRNDRDMHGGQLAALLDETIID